MRDFTDEAGRRWQVVVGRESWGAIFAIFVPRGHDAPPRQAPMRASGYGAANEELGRLTEEDLRGMLASSEPKTPG